MQFYFFFFKSGIITVSLDHHSLDYHCFFGSSQFGLSQFLWVIVFSLYRLANPQKATVALFSTMNSQFMGFLMRLLVISLFHCFHAHIASYGV